MSLLLILLAAAVAVLLCCSCGGVLLLEGQVLAIQGADESVKKATAQIGVPYFKLFMFLQFGTTLLLFFRVTEIATKSIP